MVLVYERSEHGRERVVDAHFFRRWESRLAVRVDALRMKGSTDVEAELWSVVSQVRRETRLFPKRNSRSFQM